MKKSLDVLSLEECLGEGQSALLIDVGEARTHRVTLFLSQGS